jgi:hypothetical protein
MDVLHGLALNALNRKKCGRYVLRRNCTADSKKLRVRPRITQIKTLTHNQARRTKRKLALMLNVIELWRTCNDRRDRGWMRHPKDESITSWRAVR